MGNLFIDLAPSLSREAPPPPLPRMRQLTTASVSVAREATDLAKISIFYVQPYLKAMMKDPFGNYVVQKVLETCDDASRELILSRIKVHLNALKRYTYGKHIVSRVEKLFATGEKHIGQSSSNS